MEEEYITITNLKERGWTDGIIKKMVLTADKETSNPYYKKAAPMKLFLLKRIEDLEKTEQFKELQSKSESRKAGAKKAVETKTAKLYRYVETVPIEIKYIPEPELTQTAIISYNQWQANRPSVLNGNRDYTVASENSDKEFLDRIRKNYIRHNLTNYDDVLAEIKGKIGISEVYHILKKKVMDRIDNEWILKSDESNQ